MKYCTKCKVGLPLDSFEKRKSAKDGRMTQCKPCRNETKRAKYRENGDQRRTAKKPRDTRRREVVRLHTPRGLSEDDKAVMRSIFNSRPAGHHVDHIVPLQGDTVSGLHVPWNLQYLTAEENLAKCNTWC